MSPRKLIVLTAVILVLFAFIILYERKLPTTAERESRGELVWDLPEDRIELVRIERSGEVLELHKAGPDVWRIVKPEAARADGVAVSGLVAELADLKRAEGEAPGARPADYGLEPATTKATIVWTDAEALAVKKTRTLELGIDVPGTDVTAARVGGAAPIFFVPASVATAVRKSADDFKSMEVFGGSVADVTELDVQRGRGHLVLARKSGVWWLTSPLSDLADGEAAERLAGDLTALRVLDWVRPPERQSLSALGLEPPLYRVTIKDAKGSATTVDLGATKSDGGAIYARRENQVFTVENEIVEELSKEALAFRSSQLVRFNRSDANAVEGVFGTSRYALTRKDGGWSTEGRSVLAASADDVLSAVLDLKVGSFLDDAEAKAARATTAAGSATVRLSEGVPWTILLLPRRGDVVATVTGRPGAFRLDGSAMTGLHDAFRKATAAPAKTPTAKPS
jgi:hypothetical protein